MPPDKRPGWVLVYRPWVTNKRTGKRIYPRSGRVFAFWVRTER